MLPPPTKIDRLDRELYDPELAKQIEAQGGVIDYGEVGRRHGSDTEEEKPLTPEEIHAKTVAAVEGDPNFRVFMITGQVPKVCQFVTMEPSLGLLKRAIELSKQEPPEMDLRMEEAKRCALDVAESFVAACEGVLVPVIERWRHVLFGPVPDGSKPATEETPTIIEATR